MPVNLSICWVVGPPGGTCCNLLACLKHLYWPLFSQVFKEVRIGYLPVGHTHELIDQVHAYALFALHTHTSICAHPTQIFSCFARALGISDAITLEDLHAILGGKYTPAPRVRKLEEVLNWAKLLLPLSADMHNHTRPLQFRFRLVDGVPRMWHKPMATRGEWGPTLEGVAVFKELPGIQNPCHCASLCIVLQLSIYVFQRELPFQALSLGHW